MVNGEDGSIPDAGLKNISIFKGEKTMYQDKTLICKDCGNEFVFTAGEQEFYAEKGFENEPVRCKDCRVSRKASIREKRELHSVAAGGIKFQTEFESPHPVGDLHTEGVTAAGLRLFDICVEQLQLRDPVYRRRRRSRRAGEVTSITLISRLNQPAGEGQSVCFRPGTAFEDFDFVGSKGDDRSGREETAVGKVLPVKGGIRRKSERLRNRGRITQTPEKFPVCAGMKKSVDLSPRGVAAGHP